MALFLPSRRWSVPALVREKVKRHPELARPVTHYEAYTIAAREGIAIALVALPSRIRGRLIRVGERVWIQIGRHVPRNERHLVVMHELVHFWRDDPGVMCAYADHETVNQMEEFCEVFAWAVTSPARCFVIPTSEGKGCP